MSEYLGDSWGGPCDPTLSTPEEDAFWDRAELAAPDVAGAPEVGPTIIVDGGE